MNAKKTPLLPLITQKLAALNDQFCFFLFIEQEFNRRLPDLSPAVSDLFTSDVFATNPYSPKIHVRVKQIPDFQSRNRVFTFGSYFSTSYEVVSDYIDTSSLNLLQQIIPASYKPLKHKQIEKQFFNILQASGCNIPDQELIDTLTYIRLRRNHLIHLGDSLVPWFSSHISSCGASLNAYWLGTVEELDFTSLDIDSLTEKETIDFLKLLRIITERLDSTVASSLSPENVLLFTAKQLKLTSRQVFNSDFVQRKAKMLKKQTELEFEIQCTLEQAEQAIIQTAS